MGDFMGNSTKISWTCKKCGVKTTTFASNGRPLAGWCKKNNNKGHDWKKD